jgi:hypothetical protein
VRTRMVISAICLLVATTCLDVTFAQDSAQPTPEWVGIGPDSGNIEALAIDPQNSKTLYAGTPGGLFKSTDGAATWRLSNYGLPTPNIGYAPASTVTSLAIDPQTPSTIYAGVRGISIHGCSGQCNIPVSGGIFKSTDSGATWSAINAGLETESYLGSLTIDPWNTTTVYAATSHAISPLCVPGPPCSQGYGSGVFKTMDGGATWQPASAGLPAAEALSVTLAIDPQDPNTLYDGTTKGIFKSTNGGVTWNAVMFGIGVCCLNLGHGIVVIDPINHDTVYVGRSSEIWKTTDGGGSWYMLSSPSGPTVTSLAIDPNRTLYATISHFGPSGGIFKSMDGGVSWLKASETRTRASVC